jgi:hypothetical protein
MPPDPAAEVNRPPVGCGQQARQPRGRSVLAVQLAYPLVVRRDPVERGVSSLVPSAYMRN